MEVRFMKKNLTCAMLSIALFSSYSTPFNTLAASEDEDAESIETSTDQSTESQTENISKSELGLQKSLCRPNH